MSEEKKKYTQVNFRLNERELKRWQAQADRQNVTLPKFSKDLINLFFESGTIKQAKIDKKTGAEIARNLGKLGGNVNQIARWCNTHQQDISEEQVERLTANMEQVQKELKKIWQQLS